MAEDKKKPTPKNDASSTPKPSIQNRDMAQNYGFALAFMNSDPELKHLFNQAVANTWTADKFAAELRGTKWFKNHSSAVRNAIAQQTSDPASWEASVATTFAAAKDAWGNLYGTADVDTKKLQHLASMATTLGWTQAQLIDHIASSVNYESLLNKKNLGGTAAETKSQIQQLASQFGVDAGNHWVNAHTQNVLDGNTTIGGVQAALKNLAKQQYTAFADQLDGGQTMQAIADPYVQKMANTLEMNPNQIKLTDPHIQKALTFKDPKTGKVAPMNLADFGDMMRADPRWQYTDNARQAVASIVNGLAQQWGTGA